MYFGIYCCARASPNTSHRIHFTVRCALTVSCSVYRGIPEMVKCNLIKVLVKWFMLTLGLNAMCQSVKSSIHFVPFGDKCDARGWRWAAGEGERERQSWARRRRGNATLYDDVLRFPRCEHAQAPYEFLWSLCSSIGRVAETEQRCGNRMATFSLLLLQRIPFLYTVWSSSTVPPLLGENNLNIAT